MKNLREDRTEVLAFLETLSTRVWLKFTADDIEKIAVFIDSDGCTGVPDFYGDICVIHDFHYRTHLDFYGNPMSKEAADAVLRKGIQEMSWFGKYSPMAWWRWQGVKYLASKAWSV